MNKKQWLDTYWKAVAGQEATVAQYFSPDAVINWHNTDECFTVEEFIIANCHYPGKWDGVVERLEEIGEVTVTVTHVWEVEKKISFHVTSFFTWQQDKILRLDEYWGDDGQPPEWRREMKIGKPIKEMDKRREKEE